MTTDATTNATPGFPPASAVAVVAAAAAANDNNDENDDDDDDGINLDALCRRVHDLRRMLDASAIRLTHCDDSFSDLQNYD